MKKNIGLVLASVLGGVIALFIFTQFSNNKKEIIIEQQANIPASLTSNSYSPIIQNLPDFTTSAETSIHAVVHIQTEYERKNQYYEDYFNLKDLFEHFNQSPQGNRPLMGSGSGVIISEDGYIITNNHVVEDATKISITLNDKRTYEARVIGLDPSTDLALIKVEENNLPYLVYGNSDNVRIGEWVLAVGNPFNLTSTVTAGIVSAKARNINILGQNQLGSAIESFIQTDAAVNRGNSGGALVNTKGELVGINAAIASGTGYYAGYSFAIPVNIVKKVAADLVQFGEIQRAYIGVTIGEINSKLAEELELDGLKGVYVSGITENGAAQEAGIEQGDVILEMDNLEVNTTSELLGIIGQHRPGDKVKLKVIRNGEEKYYDILMKNRRGNTDIITAAIKVENELLGAVLKEASLDDLQKYNVENGILVTEIKNGLFNARGVRKGFMITKMDKRIVRTIEDVQMIIENADGGVLIEGKYNRNSRTYYALNL